MYRPKLHWKDVEIDAPGRIVDSPAVASTGDGGPVGVVEKYSAHASLGPGIKANDNCPPTDSPLPSRLAFPCSAATDVPLTHSSPDSPASLRSLTSSLSHSSSLPPISDSSSVSQELSYTEGLDEPEAEEVGHTLYPPAPPDHVSPLEPVDDSTTVAAGSVNVQPAVITAVVTAVLAAVPTANHVPVEPRMYAPPVAPALAQGASAAERTLATMSAAWALFAADTEGAISPEERLLLLRRLCVDRSATSLQLAPSQTASRAAPPALSAPSARELHDIPSFHRADADAGTEPPAADSLVAADGDAVEPIGKSTASGDGPDDRLARAEGSESIQHRQASRRHMGTEFSPNSRMAAPEISIKPDLDDPMVVCAQRWNDREGVDLDNMIEGLRTEAAEAGFSLVVSHGLNKRGYCYLVCKRGLSARPNGSEGGKTPIAGRDAKSQRIECPFQVRIKLDKLLQLYIAKVTQNTHNHPADRDCKTHPRMSWRDSDLKTIEEAANGNATFAEIQGRLCLERARAGRAQPSEESTRNKIKTLRPKDPVSTQESFTNFIKALRREKSEVYSAVMQGDDKSTDGIFIMYDQAKYWVQRYGTHIAMDATYKTNATLWPLLQICVVVGMDWKDGQGAKERIARCDKKGKPAQSHVFRDHARRLVIPVAFGVLKSEDRATYTFMMQALRSCLPDDAEPTVIITDEDNALISAVEDTFPQSARLTCALHAKNNVIDFAKKAGFSKDDAECIGEKFFVLSGLTSEASANQDATKLLENIEGNSYPAASDDAASSLTGYLRRQWLPGAEDEERTVTMGARNWRAVSVASLSGVMTLGLRTTSSVEGMHSNLKSQNSRGLAQKSIASLFSVLKKSQARHIKRVQGVLNKQRNKQYLWPRRSEEAPIYDSLRQHNIALSYFAYDLLRHEVIEAASTFASTDFVHAPETPCALVKEPWILNEGSSGACVQWMHYGVPCRHRLLHLFEQRGQPTLLPTDIAPIHRITVHAPTEEIETIDVERSLARIEMSRRFSKLYEEDPHHASQLVERGEDTLAESVYVPPIALPGRKAAAVLARRAVPDRNRARRLNTRLDPWIKKRKAAAKPPLTAEEKKKRTAEKAKERRQRIKEGERDEEARKLIAAPPSSSTRSAARSQAGSIAASRKRTAPVTLDEAVQRLSNRPKVTSSQTVAPRRTAPKSIQGRALGTSASNAITILDDGDAHEPQPKAVRWTAKAIFPARMRRISPSSTLAAHLRVTPAEIAVVEELLASHTPSSLRLDDIESLIGKTLTGEKAGSSQQSLVSNYAFASFAEVLRQRATDTRTGSSHTSEGSERVAILNAFAWSTWRGHTRNGVDLQTAGNRGEPWDPHLSIFHPLGPTPQINSFDYVLCPIHIPGLVGHWILARFDVRRREVQVFDSLVKTPTANQGIANELIDFIKYVLRRSNGGVEPEGAWTMIPAPSNYPHQGSSIECGIFVMAGMERMSRADFEMSDSVNWGWALKDSEHLRLRFAVDALKQAARR